LPCEKAAKLREVLTSLQALLRLATLRWLGVFVCALAVLLATPSTASALEPAQTKTRVWGFDFAAHNSVGLFRAASLGKHQGICSARAEAASGSLLAARGAGKPVTGLLSDVTVVSRGNVVGRGTVDLRGTLEGIKSGEIGVRDVFRNREGLLPSKPGGYYQEFLHPTPGVQGAGSQRIIQGQGGELFYTPDHYKSFIPLN